MATKKDLVEAYSFSRRRLVTAFVSGAPGGREVEPSRPGRTLVGGIALSVLLVAGAAVLGFLKPADPTEIDKRGLVIEEGTGADYVILRDGGPLQPIVNITSAMLILGAEPETTELKPELIAELDRDERIGILEAPETPPRAGSLVQSGWTACAGGDLQGGTYGLKVYVGDDPGLTPLPDSGFVVRAGKDRYLIAEASSGFGGQGVPTAYAYKLPKGDDANRIVQAVVPGAPSTPIDVPVDWVALFPSEAGDLALEAFDLTQETLGQRPTYAQQFGIGSQPRLGDVLRGPNDDEYLLARGALVRLDPFSRAVYDIIRNNPERIEIDEPPADSRALNELNSTRWPTSTLVPKTDAASLCAELNKDAGGLPRVRLGSAGSDTNASAAEVSAGTLEQDVAPGAGAVVLRADSDTTGVDQRFMVDDLGYAYELAGDAYIQLGYEDVDDVIVPDAWMDLFEVGVTLSEEAALCPVRPESDPCA